MEFPKDADMKPPREFFHSFGGFLKQGSLEGGSLRDISS
jgi:hypothetical protein